VSLLKVIDKANGYAIGYLGEPARDLDSMPEFGEWNDDVAMQRVAEKTPLPPDFVMQPVKEEAVAGVASTAPDSTGGA